MLVLRFLKSLGQYLKLWWRYMTLVKRNEVGLYNFHYQDRGHFSLVSREEGFLDQIVVRWVYDPIITPFFNKKVKPLIKGDILCLPSYAAPKVTGDDQKPNSYYWYAVTSTYNLYEFEFEGTALFLGCTETSDNPF